MVRKVFQLVDKDGQALTSVDAVDVVIEDVFAFRDAVIRKCPNILKNVDAADLTVFANGVELEEDSPIGSFGGSKRNALVVVVRNTIPIQQLNASYDLLQVVLPHVLTDAPTTISDRNEDFKDNLCQFYHCYSRKKKWVRCMVLDIPFPKRVVTAAHLFRRSNEYLADSMMQIRDIDNPKNGMLMFKPLEVAFDHFQISFIATGDGTSFELKVFDQSIQTTPLIDFINDPNQLQVVMDAVSTDKKPNKRCKFDLRTTFGDIDGKRIVFSSPNRPYNRCLNLQARLAHMIALKKGSIDVSYQFSDFWSDGMSLADKMEIFQRSISANY